MRQAIFGLLSILIACLFCVICAEIFLRFLPVDTGLRAQPVDGNHPVLHFQPNRDFVWSRDWDFSIVNHGRTNNDGWVNDQDYVRDDKRPLLGVIGDSYIEAAMVPYAETMQGRLAAATPGGLRVYSFGVSGGALTQYLMEARHAVTEWGATSLVIAIIGNDFDESLEDYKKAPGFWAYANGPDGLQLRLTDYHPNLLRRVAVWFALTRYLAINAGGNYLPDRLRGMWAQWTNPAPAPRYAGNTDAAVDDVRVAKSKAAITAFFRDLPRLTGLPADRILFVMDGARSPADEAAERGTYIDLMRQAFMAEALSRGYETIDLQPRFVAGNAAAGTQYQFPTDGHWNGAGHAVAADAVKGSALYAKVTAETR